MGVALGLTLTVYTITFILMKRTELQSLSASTESKQKIARFKDTEARAKSYTEDLKIAKSIFSSELSYTTALHKIAGALPQGSVVEALDLNPATISAPVSLAVSAKNKDIALSVKESLEKAKVASNITISSLQEEQAAQGQTSGDYPIQISLNLTFSKSIFTPGDDNA